ncbi:Flp pilus assembly protein CpaB [Limnohabitans sp. Jir72]|nr:Flp pilus assembly protein CpaB [Limnohabitans sp. Jir72]
MALLLGALATFFVARGLGLVGRAASASEVTLVVAASTIYSGQPIESAQLKLLAWPKEGVPEQSFTKSSLVAGRIAKQTIYPGELLLEPKLAGIDSRGGLAAAIESGKRAISVRVNDVVGVAGFALPGSYVDVLVSAKDAANMPFSTTVLNRIKVLAVAQETEADPAKAKVVNAVTLELTPVEAEKLDLARSIGALSLVLRSENDAVDVASSGTRLDDILRSGNRPSARVVGKSVSAPAAPDTVTSIRGIAKRQEQP